MKTAAVFFADGFEDVEALSPVDYLRRAKVEVTTVSVPSQGMHDKHIVTSSHKVSIFTDDYLEDYLKKCEKNLPDCVVIPGGSLGAQNLSVCKELLNFLEKCDSQGKLIGAICASPAVVLGKTDIPDGKKWTCYPEMEGESGPHYIKNYVNQTFVTDGNLVTARGAGSAEEFSMELVRILCGEETAKRIHDGTQMR